MRRAERDTRGDASCVRYKKRVTFVRYQRHTNECHSFTHSQTHSEKGIEEQDTSGLVTETGIFGAVAQCFATIAMSTARAIQTKE